MSARELVDDVDVVLSFARELSGRSAALRGPQGAPSGAGPLTGPARLAGRAHGALVAAAAALAVAADLLDVLDVELDAGGAP